MVIGAMSPAEAALRADCKALGLTPDVCDEQVRNHTMPDGSICDGDIVIDASGKRCIPRAVAAAVAAQRAASLGTKFDPLSPSAAAGATADDAGGAVRVAVGLALGAVIVWGLSKVLA